MFKLIQQYKKEKKKKYVLVFIVDIAIFVALLICCLCSTE